jgi:phosphoribosylformimino-5-aminoimidazole carboxamide ribotide isomerase
VVRLRQGDPAAETTFGENPSETARRWEREGAAWLHVVNLDGALGVEDRTGQASINLRSLEAIAGSVAARIQFGGGIRTLADIERALGLGAARVVIGTIAVNDPGLVGEAVSRFGPERIVVALDARDGKVVTHGWQETTTLSAGEVALRMADLGVLRLLYTDVTRDGMLVGANVEATARLARESRRSPGGGGLGVIASGGVGAPADITALVERSGDGIEGVVVGQALYTGAVCLEQALRIAARAGA